MSPDAALLGWANATDRQHAQTPHPEPEGVAVMRGCLIAVGAGLIVAAGVAVALIWWLA